MNDILAATLIIGLAIAGLFGWIWNIVKIVAAISDPFTLLLLLRVIGIPMWPLGCVLGFL